MALVQNRPFREVTVTEGTTSIAATPVVASAIAPCSGYVRRVFAASGGTTTGTITVAVTINGGSDICGGALTIPAGSGNNGSSVVNLQSVGSGAVFINEGDFILFTPSGGTGSNINGTFALVIHSLT
jgi:hypothetical protein